MLCQWDGLPIKTNNSCWNRPRSGSDRGGGGLCESSLEEGIERGHKYIVEMHTCIYKTLHLQEIWRFGKKTTSFA